MLTPVQIKGVILTFLTKSFHTSQSNSIKRLSKEERSKFTLDEFLKQVLIGTLLGDFYMWRSSDAANVRAVFRQGSTNADYLLHLYGLFQHFVQTPQPITALLCQWHGIASVGRCAPMAGHPNG